MSFILDALKKSESDRQRQSGPSLFEVKVAPPRRTLPIWAVVVAALLAINVIVISWMLLRHPAAPPSAQMPPPTVAASHAIGQNTAPARAAVPPGISASAPPGPVGTAAPPSATPPVQQAAHAPSASQPAAAVPPASGAEQSAGPGAAAGAPSDTAPAVEPGAESGSGASQDAAGDLPLYQQIVSSAGLPELHLDLHVFAARPQDRFVMINMHRLGEGDSLPNGAHVEAIRPDGVVLTYHGTRFLLPRN
ncbi:MAG TPA: general secretion pathway protein GspB [Steroidobacteraceae bacterium]